MSRMNPADRRATIVSAALEVAVVKGLASTTVRDVAAAMGTSSGLIHHYFESMDDVLAAAFEQVARQDLDLSERLMAQAPDPVAALRTFFVTYTPADKDWAFQLWLDAWAEAARRPAIQATSRRLNLEWQALLESTISAGVSAGTFSCVDPRGAAWRILSLLDGLALQVVAHGTTISRADVVSWAASATEAELGLAIGSLVPEPIGAESSVSGSPPSGPPPSGSMPPVSPRRARSGGRPARP
ncbi:MAG: TetR family transcriptional regulator C-terminal domain-containing protein [Chloroflexi bacterium]|nr:TetR family transcriptional regulator C-terminal domain-containing protein [Chloroflexota bacterium]